MSHYGIVKRQRYWIEPKWYEEMRLYQHCFNYLTVNNEVRKVEAIKHENMELGYFGVKYNNVIHEVLRKGLLITYWEGKVNHAPLNIGETMVIDEEKFTISKVEKDVDGVVTYYVDDLILESEDYNDLLSECEKKYEEHSKKLKHNAEKFQQLYEAEKVNENPFTDPKQVKSRWKRIFKLK